MRKKAIVIGAGIGGMTTACVLAANGWQVTVFEKNATVGGKMGEVKDGDFRWDTGPSVITMHHVLEKTFALNEKTIDDYIELIPVNPLTRYFYTDGTVLDASSDLTQMTRAIEKINEKDVAGYLRYLAYAADIHRITGPVFIYNEPPKIQDILSVPLYEMPKVDPLRTMNQAIDSFVKSPHMRQLLGRFATYTGASPYKAPATLNVIADVELRGGVWYPKGGIYTIAQGLQTLMTELGIDIITEAPVEKIDTQNGQVTGITLATGKHIQADAVVANFDVSLVYEKLLDDQESAQKLNQLEPSCSGFIMLLGIEGKHPELAHHNIFFSDDYPTEFIDIFEKEIPPENPTIYVTITSHTDSDHAPDNHENWFVMVNAPALSEKYDWINNTTAYRNMVLETLASYGFDIRDQIRVEHILTPIDIERLTGARRGALYGVSSNSKWTAFRRPHNRAKDVRGLYFTGGTTHPGGGVPMVMLSGQSAGRIILEDYET